MNPSPATPRTSAPSGKKSFFRQLGLANPIFNVGLGISWWAMRQFRFAAELKA